MKQLKNSIYNLSWNVLTLELLLYICFMYIYVSQFQQSTMFHSLFIIYLAFCAAEHPDSSLFS